MVVITTCRTKKILTILTKWLRSQVPAPIHSSYLKRSHIDQTMSRELSSTLEVPNSISNNSDEIQVINNNSNGVNDYETVK